MIKLFTDSAAYIPMDLQVEYDIQVFHYTFLIDGKRYEENEIHYDSFYKDISKSKEIPQTRPISYEQIYSAFENEIKQGNAVVAVFLSSAYNDSYSNAYKAAQRLKEIHSHAKIQVIDSKSSCMEQGLAVLAAAEKISEDAWIGDVVNAARESKSYTRAMIIPEKLKYMEFNGKINKAQAILGEVTGAAPILTTHNGSIELMERTHSKHRAILRAMEILKEDLIKYGAKTVVVQHINAFEEAEVLANKLREFTDTQVIVSEIGPAIGARFGPGTIALMYRTVEKIV